MTEKRKALGRGLESLLPPRPFSSVPSTVAANLSPKEGEKDVTPTLSPEEGEKGGEPGGAPGASSAPAWTMPAPSHKEPSPIEELVTIPVDRIAFSRYQPRKACDQERLDELARSIEEVGLVQPIVVRSMGVDSYELVAGERRLRATRQGGFNTISAVLRETSDLEQAEMVLLENLQREDLNPMELAAAFHKLGSGLFHLTQEEIAKRSGKDRSTVANFLRLLRLPEEVQALVAEGKLSFGHAKALMSLPTPGLMIEVAHKIAKDELTVRQAEALVAGRIETRPKEKKERVVDPNVREAEETLHRALGVPVTITDRNGKGKIVLEYGSLEDFDRILGAVTGK